MHDLHNVIDENAAPLRRNGAIVLSGQSRVRSARYGDSTRNNIAAPKGGVLQTANASPPSGATGLTERYHD